MAVKMLFSRGGFAHLCESIVNLPLCDGLLLDLIVLVCTDVIIEV